MTWKLSEYATDENLMNDFEKSLGFRMLEPNQFAYEMAGWEIWVMENNPKLWAKIKDNDLKMWQSMPFELIVMNTYNIIYAWNNEYDMYVSVSGGKDSQVLLDLVKQMNENIESVFCDTGLELDGVRAKGIELSNQKIRPKMLASQILTEYGYPCISKEVSECVEQAKLAIEQAKYVYRVAKLQGKPTEKYNFGNKFSKHKYAPLLYVPFNISKKCCKICKIEPLAEYEKANNKVCFVGTLAEESANRATAYNKSGVCINDYRKSNKPISKPLSRWTNDKILEYIKRRNLTMASDYGNVIEVDDNDIPTFAGCGTKLKCSGIQRSGCSYCMFGAHAEKESRYLFLKNSYPKKFDYVMRGGKFNEQGKWVPHKGLGMAYVINWLNALYSRTLKSGKVKKFIDIDVSEFECPPITQAEIDEVWRKTQEFYDTDFSLLVGGQPIKNYVKENKNEVN